MKFAFVATLAAIAAAPAFAFEAKGLNSTVSRADPLECKFGSGKILGACGDCATNIYNCVQNATGGGHCGDQIKKFFTECGGCAVDILECL